MMTTNQTQQPAQSTKAQDLLHRAASLMDERGKQYDQRSGERSMQATVTAFNAISGYCLTEADGFLLMAILKMVRDQSREMPHRDSIDDLVAYASLYGEARLHGEARRQSITRDESKVCEALDHMESGLKAHKEAQESRQKAAEDELESFAKAIEADKKERRKAAHDADAEQKWPHEGQHYTREQMVQKIALAHQAAQEARYAGR
jgi:hypothetical protein